MKTLNRFLAEADDDSTDLETTKKSIIQFVSSNLARFINRSDKEDVISMMMLIAALQLVNIATDVQSLTVARRLAMTALSKAGKKA